MVGRSLLSMMVGQLGVSGWWKKITQDLDAFQRDILQFDLGSVTWAAASCVRSAVGTGEAQAISGSGSGITGSGSATGALESVSGTMFSDPLMCLISLVNSAM